jgi:c-di-GMP-binding flagellar brake protein YcgR
MTTAENPITLLAHDGELIDLLDLLDDLGTAYVERRGEPEADDFSQPWDLIIATPRRLLARPFQATQKHIAICDQDSRTLRNSLRRAGIDLMVRRPVHPAALRALLLHALYRGPEKRRMPRVNIGAQVRFRAGWRQRPAILADLSMSGCRLLSEHQVRRGKAFTLNFPVEVAGDKAFSVKARVVRAARTEVPPPGTNSITVAFESVGPSTHARLKATIAAHSSGPAMFDDATALRPVAPQPAAAAPEVPVAEEDEAPADLDRRDGARHATSQRVIALADEATRVLMGRDISLGGMRVDSNPLLSVGDALRLAIHVNGLDVPLIVDAEVHRNDGEHGVALRFLELSSDARRYLGNAVEELPVLEPGEEEGDKGYIVSQILEVECA